MLSLRKPCGGRDDLCVQEVQARCRNSPSHPLPSIITRILFRGATRTVAKDCGSDAGMYGRATKRKEEGANKTVGLQETVTGEEGGGGTHREREGSGQDRWRYLARGEVKLLAKPSPPSKPADSLTRPRGCTGTQKSSPRG